MATSKLQLIPWDPESEDHIDLLVEHRHGCGWHAEKPPGDWRDSQRAGIKCIYWLVLPSDDPERDSRLEAHGAKFPKQRMTIKDTCTVLRNTPVSPTGVEFMPIGHIALDSEYKLVDGLGLDLPSTGVIWIKSLWVSAAIQSSGLGRAAMNTLEAMASSEPLLAKTLMLDTVKKEDQFRPEYSTSGVEAPKMSNEEWYARRGYRTIKEIDRFYAEETKHIPKEIPMRTVFMRKDL